MHLYPDSSDRSLNVGQIGHVRHMVGYGYVDLKNWTYQYETGKLDFSDRGDNLGDQGLSGTKGVCPTKPDKEDVSGHLGFNLAKPLPRGQSAQVTRKAHLGHRGQIHHNGGNLPNGDRVWRYGRM